jgi:hypothetical protein
MKRPDHAPTWGEAGADPLQELFDRAHDDGFTSREIERLWSRLVVFMAMPTPRTGSGGSAGGSLSNAARGISLKTATAFVVGGLAVVGAAAQGWRLFEQPDRTAAVSTAIAPVAVPASTSTTATDWTVAPSVSPSAKVGAESPGIAPKANVTTVSERHEPPRVDPAPRVQSSFAAPEPSHAIPLSSPPSPPAASKPAVDVEGPRSEGAPPTSADQAPTEGALLLQARRAMASDPARALALTDEHARRFPSGDLGPEREVLAIEALCALKRRSEARARLDVFRRQFPQSLHVARLERLLAQ